MDNQKELPFAEAEGSLAERKALLGNALLRIGASLYVAKLLEMVFHLTDGGRPGRELVKSYDELAAGPWWLCCSRSCARNAVSVARSRGLLLVEEQRYVSDGQRANAYQINWAGVAAVARGERYAESSHLRTAPAGRGEVAAELGAGDRVSFKDTGVSPKDRGVLSGDTGVSFKDTPIRKDYSSVVSSYSFRPGGTAGEVLPDPWGPIREGLLAVGFERAGELVAELVAKNASPTEAAEILAEYAANASRCKLGPGAIASRFRSGHWPTPGVVPVAELREREATRATVDQSHAARVERFELYRRRREILRAHGGDVEAALDTLRREVPAWVLVEAGDIADEVPR